jgi:GNAT superfamily N-acetyltransferase
MTDLLVKLYELFEVKPYLESLQKEGIKIRRAMAYEKHQVVEWVQNIFGKGWASECDIAFSHEPISCFIAMESSNLVGFACYDCTGKNFFGPIGVAERARNRGIGRALLMTCLHAMAASGYAYAVIGGVDSKEFFEKTAGAIEIPGSSPGIYRDRLSY